MAIKRYSTGAVWKICVERTEYWYPLTPTGLFNLLFCIFIGATKTSKELVIWRAIVTVFLAQGRRQFRLGRSLGRPQSLSKRVLIEIRVDEHNQYAQPKKEAWRALFKDRCRTTCSECDIVLYRKCFERFHAERIQTKKSILIWREKFN